ncbi:MAG: aminopeptidase [Pseudomonadota bacterium]
MAVLFAVLMLQGCGAGYYAKSLNGHLEVLQAREKVDVIRNDPEAPAPLRAQMDVAADIRQFAIDELALPDNASYRSYVDLGREYVTVAVFAAPEFSLAPQTWCFPVFGCVPYRAHFSKDAAARQAQELRDAGFDVHVSGVTAYSTLGWTPDPLLNTMFRYGDINAAAVVFHELAHQQVYIRDDSAFNEAFAVAVEIEGVKAWLRARGNLDGLRRYEASLKRRRDFLALITDARRELFDIYRNEQTDALRRKAKAAAIDTLRANYARVRDARWGGFSGYDRWFEAPINNAKLGASGLYNDLVPDFRALFEVCGRDFERFYAAVERLGGMKRDVRRTALSDTSACL